MKSLRFCMITTFYPPYCFGGDAVFVQGLSRELVARGHSVDVIHCEDAYRIRGTEPAIAAATDDGITVHRLRSPLGFLSPLITQQTGGPGLKRAAIARILSRGFDVIHFHNISLVGGPRVLAMGQAPVKLYTTHEHWLVCPMHVLWKNRCKPCDSPQCFRCCLRSGVPPQLWRYTDMIRRNLEHVDALLVPSHFSAERHRQAGITRPIHLLPTFGTIHPPAAAPFEPPQRPTFLYAGRLTISKGVLDMINQFSRLPQYDLVLAGDGELRDQLEREVDRVANIRCLGPVSRTRLIELFGQSTAVILPSIGPEVFPLIVLEAMACSTPVVVREVGGSAEAVRATGGGIVYKRSEELPSVLGKLADDPSSRAALARCASEGYRRLYTPETHLNNYLELIESMDRDRVRPHASHP